MNVLQILNKDQSITLCSEHFTQNCWDGNEGKKNPNVNISNITEAQCVTTHHLSREKYYANLQIWNCTIQNFKNY